MTTIWRIGPRGVWVMAWLLAAAALASSSGCGRKTCLAGDEACEEAEICTALGPASDCEAAELWLGTVADAPGGLDYTYGDAARTDIVMRNGAITVVLDALDSPHDLAPTGGNILDLAPRGGRDGLNSLYQAAGILPDDALAYTSMELIDRSPELIAVVVRGTLDGRPEVEVVTRYELRPCDQGVRVRSELVNGSPDVLPLFLGDVIHWGQRDTQPFAPVADEGYVHPALDLLNLDKSWNRLQYVLARSPYPGSSAYGLTSCGQSVLEGINDYQISALGTERRIVRPGESLTLQRYIATAPGPGLAAVTEAILDARERMFGPRTRTVLTGRVVAGGLPVAGNGRRAMLMIFEQRGAERRPVTELEPGEDGVFAVSLTTDGELDYELWSFGRVVQRGDIGSGRTVDLGDLEITEPARLGLTIVDNSAAGGQPMYGLVAIHPADEATRAAVTGTWYGRLGECAPWLGPPFGGSPACNQVLVTPTGAEVELLPGNYVAYATAGPDWTLARLPFSAAAGEVVALEAVLAPVEVRPAGWLAADLHVHGRASFDSGVPDEDRVISFAAAGVDVIAATDHDYVTDYRRALVDTGLDGRIAVMGGVEMSQFIPFMEVPGDDFPRVIGHFNFWPITPDPQAPRGGGPWDELSEPGELIDRMRPLIGEGGMAMINHPWDEPLSGRDLGYLRAIGFDPRLPIPESDDGTRQGMLVRRPGGGARNIDVDVMEVANGASLTQMLKTRPLWASLLSQGFIMTGAANSDSHNINDSLGYGRTLVDVDMTVETFDDDEFNRALRDGRAIGANPVVVLVTIGSASGPRRGQGFMPYAPQNGDVVEIEVRAPPWVPVTEVRALTSRGTTVLASGTELTVPADPFGTDGVVRWRGSVALGQILEPGTDDWLVIEAGIADYLAADLDDNGVVDTSDNNRDGVVDDADVQPDEDTGPLVPPPDPGIEDDSDPRYLITRVVPGAWPIGFTNPFLIDWAGNGWTPPGVGANR